MQQTLAGKYALMSLEVFSRVYAKEAGIGEEEIRAAGQPVLTGASGIQLLEHYQNEMPKVDFTLLVGKVER